MVMVMAKKSFDEDSLMAMALEVDWLANNMSDYLAILNDPLSEKNPIGQGVRRGAEIFLNHAREESPYWTGLLFSAHVAGNEEYSKDGEYSFSGKASVFIDPNVQIEHPFLGGFPAEYGPKYHREQLQWFGIAQEASEEEFFRLVDGLFANFFAETFFRGGI